MSRRLALGEWGKVSIRPITATDPDTGKTTILRYRAVAWQRMLDGHRRQVVASGPTKSKAEAQLLVSLRRNATAHTRGQITVRTTMADLADAWYEEAAADPERFEASSLYGYASCIRAQIKPLFGKFRLDEISVGLIDGILKARRAAGYSTRMLEAVLAHMLGMAIRHRALPGFTTNPMRDVSRASRRSKNARPRTLTPSEHAALRQTIRAWQDTPMRNGASRSDVMLDVFDLQYALVTRISETLAVQKKHVLLDKDSDTGELLGTGRVIVSGKVGYVPPDRRKPGAPAFQRQEWKKGHARAHTVAIRGHIVEMLARRVADAGPDEFVFRSPYGNPLNPHNLRANWRSIRTGVDLDDVVPHTLRKSAASKIADHEGLDAAGAALGHRPGSSVTGSVYVDNAVDLPDYSPHLDEVFVEPVEVTGKALDTEEA